MLANRPSEIWYRLRSWVIRVSELHHRKKNLIVRILFYSLNQELRSQNRKDGNASAAYVRMVESHMRTLDAILPRSASVTDLVDAVATNQPSRKLSFLLSLFSPIPLSHAVLPCPRYPFCLCKARAGKVVSSAFGRLIALAYSTKFGRTVPLSGTTQEFSTLVLAPSRRSPALLSSI